MVTLGFLVALVFCSILDQSTAAGFYAYADDACNEQIFAIEIANGTLVVDGVCVDATTDLPPEGGIPWDEIGLNMGLTCQPNGDSTIGFWRGDTTCSSQVPFTADGQVFSEVVVSVADMVELASVNCVQVDDMWGNTFYWKLAGLETPMSQTVCVPTTQAPSTTAGFYAYADNACKERIFAIEFSKNTLMVDGVCVDATTDLPPEGGIPWDEIGLNMGLACQPNGDSKIGFWRGDTTCSSQVPFTADGQVFSEVVVSATDIVELANTNCVQVDDMWGNTFYWELAGLDTPMSQTICVPTTQAPSATAGVTTKTLATQEPATEAPATQAATNDPSATNAPLQTNEQDVDGANSVNVVTTAIAFGYFATH